MKLKKFTTPISYAQLKLKLESNVVSRLDEYKTFYEETYGHKIEDVTGKQDALSLFVEKILVSFMDEDKAFNKKNNKIETNKKSVVLSHKTESVSTGSKENVEKQGHSNQSDSVKAIEKELLGGA